MAPIFILATVQAPLVSQVSLPARPEAGTEDEGWLSLAERQLRAQTPGFSPLIGTFLEAKVSLSFKYSLKDSPERMASSLNFHTWSKQKN